MTATTKKIEEAKSSETPVTDKAHRMAEDALEAAVDKAGSLERKLRDESGKLGEQVNVHREDVTQRFDETLSEVEKYIRKKPVAAAGIAFAAGMFAALLIKR
jgi:ElaB/YqjD/DUF883 family membrane-anchored ribosome-binding protein